MTRLLTIVDVAAEGPKLSAVYSRVCELLRRRGVEARISTTIPISVGASDPILVLDDADHPMDAALPLSGMPTLTRADRLILLRQAKVPVLRWASPRSTPQLRALLDEWRCVDAVLKRDRSGNRIGVQRVGKTDRLPRWFDPSCDVVMMRAAGAPVTLKLYVLHDVVLCAGRMDTLPVDHPEFATRDLTFEFCRPPAALRIACLSAARTFARYGVGMFSVDFMMHNRRWHAIEANTCGASRVLIFGGSRWSTVDRFSDACARWVASRGSRRRVREHLSEVDRLLRRTSAAGKVPPNPEGWGA